MIRETSVEVGVRHGKARTPIFLGLKEIADKVAQGLIERDNRTIHVDWRWHSRWLRTDGDEHIYEIRVVVIYGYVEAQHCINSDDLFYCTQADPKQQVLRTIDPSTLPRAVFVPGGQIPAIAPLAKTRTFHRQRLFVQFPSVKCPLNQKPEIFNDYWSLYATSHLG